MFKDNIAWYDVDSDEEFSIPFLPPLPAVEILCFPGTSVEKEKQFSTVTLSETSELSSSAPGSSQNAVECVQDASDRFRIQFDQVASSLKSRKTATNSRCFNAKFSEHSKNKTVPKYVCFIGKFPKLTTIDDFKSFVKSNGINFTEIRVGPKKNKNATTFGYVDLPTKRDYNKLLALDGSFYKRRKIRIDRATRKEPSQQHDAIYQATRKTHKGRGDQTAEFGSSRQKSYYTTTLEKGHSSPIDGKKTRLNPLKPRLKHKGVGCNKVTARSQRWKRIMYDQKRGCKNNQKYTRSPKFSGAAMNTINSSRSRHTTRSGGASNDFSGSNKSGRVGQLPQHASF